jgi:hypothetical protein
MSANGAKRPPTDYELVVMYERLARQVGARLRPHLEQMGQIVRRDLEVPEIVRLLHSVVAEADFDASRAERQRAA